MRVLPEELTCQVGGEFAAGIRTISRVAALEQTDAVNDALALVQGRLQISAIRHPAVAPLNSQNLATNPLDQLLEHHDRPRDRNRKPDLRARWRRRMKPNYSSYDPTYIRWRAKFAAFESKCFKALCEFVRAHLDNLLDGHYSEGYESMDDLPARAFEHYQRENEADGGWRGLAVTEASTTRSLRTNGDVDHLLRSLWHALSHSSCRCHIGWRAT
jgi:hypothetical protein